jgi:hypothetical protein
MENPVIGFKLEYGGNLVYCEATMQDNYYEISFDGNPIGTIEHDEDLTWRPASGTILPQSIISEIGERIESNYL